MRKRFVIFVIMAFSAVITASAQTSAELGVSDLRFIYDINSKYNVRYTNSTSNDRSPFNSEIVQEISAIFSNNGTKTIAKISWQFIVYNNSDRTKIVYIHTLKNKTEIFPNESVRVGKTGRFWGNSQYIEANIFRIEYSDGTFWEGVKK